MNIRDDRGRGRRTPPSVPTKLTVFDFPNMFSPDAVLYDCPDCGRSHFVTVDPCPDARMAELETGMVGR